MSNANQPSKSPDILVSASVAAIGGILYTMHMPILAGLSAVIALVDIGWLLTEKRQDKDMATCNTSLWQ